MILPDLFFVMPHSSPPDYVGRGFLRKNGYECYESQAAAWYFSNINDSETYKEIARNHFRFNWKTVMRVDRNV